MQRRRQRGRLKLQSVGQMPLQRQSDTIMPVISSDFIHQMTDTAIGVHHNMLAVIQKAEARIIRRQRPRPAPGRFTGLEHCYICFSGQINRSRQTAPTRTDNRYFPLHAHGLNPNNQVFNAIRFFLGPGMAIL